MNERRQRAARALGAGVLALAILTVAGSGCQAENSIGGIQTAVAVAQTALPAAQTALPGIETALPGVETALPGMQTALPGLQATIQAGATLVGGALSGPQASQLQPLLGGASVTVTTTPLGATNAAATEVTVVATDTNDSFAQLDPTAQAAAANGAMLLVAQYYPNALISLSVVDSDGGAILSGTKALGQPPSIQ